MAQGAANRRIAEVTVLRRHLVAARVTGRELRRTRRLLRDRGVKAAHAGVRPLPVVRGRGRVVHRTLRVLRASCLERALILQAWHADTGDPRDLVIGVRSPGEDFGAHAWLDGFEPASEADFQEIVRLPPPVATGLKGQ